MRGISLRAFGVVSLIMAAPFADLMASPGVTYQGRLLGPTGEPVTSSAMQFRLQIRTAQPESCLMYQETQVKNLSSTRGFFSLSLNDGTATVVNTEPFGLAQVFQNRGAISFPAGKCAGDNNFVLNALASRQLLISFKDASMADWENLPAQELSFVPTALESVSVGGFRGGQLFRVVDPSGDPVTLSAWTEAEYDHLRGLITGTENLTGSSAGFTGSLSGDVTGSQGTTSVVRLQSRPVSSVAPLAGQVLKWDGTSWAPANDDGGGGGGSPDWNDVMNKPATFAPGGSAGGDLTGTYPNPTLANSSVGGAKIVDGGVGFSKIAAGSASGQVLQFNGTSWSAGKLHFSDLVNNSGVSPWPGACGPGQYVTWVSAIDGFSCVDLPDPSWADIQGKPTTVSGFGITDAGTVTQVATGTGLTGGPITTTGTISIANLGVGTAQLADTSVTTAKIADAQVTDAKITAVAVNKIASGAGLYLTYAPNGSVCTAGQVLKWNNSRWECAADSTLNGADYVAKAGDTMTGTLTLPTNGLVVGSTQLVASGGNVGIGTASPAARLDVVGTVAINASHERAIASVNSGASYSIPDITQNIRQIVLNDNTTLTLPSVASLPSLATYTLTLVLIQDATGGRTVTWAGGGNSIKWDSGSAPTIASGANEETIVQLMFIGGKAHWYGSMVWKE